MPRVRAQVDAGATAWRKPGPAHATTAVAVLVIAADLATRAAVVRIVALVDADAAANGKPRATDAGTTSAHLVERMARPSTSTAVAHVGPEVRADSGAERLTGRAPAGARPAD